MQQITSTLKPREVEETLDVVFYRPCGYGIASVAARMHMTPNALTAVGTAVGIIAGHLLWYETVALNLTGIMLLIVSEMIDSADGQLARMTNHFTEYGRFIDGFGDNLKFVSVYFHLALRLSASIGVPGAFLMAAAAGLSHSFQSALADYYRTAFLGFALGHSRKELKTSRELSQRHQALSWIHEPIEKLFLRLYINYTHQQEMMTESFTDLNTAASARWNGSLPESFAHEYYLRNRPMIKYYNMLTTNTRMFVLIAAVLANAVIFYFLFDLIVLNLLLSVVIMHQSEINRTLYEKIHNGVYT